VPPPDSASLPRILATARAGAVGEAWRLFRAAGLEGELADPATLAVKGRLLKAQAGALAEGAGRTALLAHSESLIRNFTENLMQYGLGRRIEYFDQPALRAIVRKAAANDYHFSSFVLGVVNSAAFQMSRADAVQTTDNSQVSDRPAKGSRR